MNIIQIPHPTLRSQASVITNINNKFVQFLNSLGSTLAEAQNPKGVGLAAPQVNKKWRVFASYLPNEVEDLQDEPSVSKLRFFINPELLDHADELTLGPNPKEPRLEGCLSMPGLYGPVPRWQKIKLKFCELDFENLKQAITQESLLERSEYFSDFYARVILHELDHLDGVLFTDHIQNHNLPIYKENAKTKKLEEIDYSTLKNI